MRCCLTVLLILVSGTGLAADAPKPNALTPDEVADGWVQLFDGDTTFGWKIDGDAKVENSELQIGGPNKSSATTANVFGDFRLRFEYAYEAKGGAAMQLILFGKSQGIRDRRAPAWCDVEYTVTHEGDYAILVLRSPPQARPAPNRRINPPSCTSVGFGAAAGDTLRLRNVRIKPVGLDPIFNGKDLSDWKRFTANEKQAKSKFTVTPEGWLNIKNGPGDLQTEKQWADFVFQGECISNGKALNSGVFFRCIPGQYQLGYEYQIHNGFKDNDRTKPADFGTGAIYRRVAARKVVPNDHEWFTMTLIAHGNHISTWVNGYQTVDWTDTRKENENARNGCKLGAGPISLQGHDPTTDLSFRNLRVAELKK
jgi:hypothetical protein